MDADLGAEVSEDAIKLGTKKKKKNFPRNGEAWVEGLTNEQRKIAVQKLDKKHIQDRFIEVSEIAEESGAEVSIQNSTDHGVVSLDSCDVDGACETKQKKKRKIVDAAEEAPSLAGSPPKCTQNVEALDETENPDQQRPTAIRLLGLPFSATSDDVYELFQTHAKRICLESAEESVWLGEIGFAASREQGMPCRGEAWISYDLERCEEIASEKELRAILQEHIHCQNVGSRFVEVSIVDTTTQELVWESGANSRSEKIQANSKGRKGQGKMGSSENGGKKGDHSSKGGSKGKGKKGDEREVFVRFLPYESTEENVKDFFGVCGEVERVKLFKAGIGFVTYRRAEDAKRAIADLDDVPYNSRTLKVGYDIAQVLRMFTSLHTVG